MVLTLTNVDDLEISKHYNNTITLEIGDCQFDEVVAAVISEDVDGLLSKIDEDTLREWCEQNCNWVREEESP